jgi:hypothetical protein
MISTMFGAPFGGTTRGGHQGFDWAALRLISPPNGCGGCGRYLPSIVVVALEDPGVPVTYCAAAGTAIANVRPRSNTIAHAASRSLLLTPTPAILPWPRYDI